MGEARAETQAGGARQKPPAEGPERRSTAESMEGGAMAGETVGLQDRMKQAGVETRDCRDRVMMKVLNDRAEPQQQATEVESGCRRTEAKGMWSPLEEETGCLWHSQDDDRPRWSRGDDGPRWSRGAGSHSEANWSTGRGGISRG